MIYDADTAGIKASLKNCELLLRAGAKVKCIRLPRGTDPDDFAKSNGEKTQDKLKNMIETFPKAFKRLLIPNGCKDETIIADGINSICSLIACIQDAGLRLEYIKSVATDFKSRMNIIDDKVRNIRVRIKEAFTKTKTQTGIFGIDALKENLENDRPGILTSVLQEFLDQYGEEPILYVAGRPSNSGCFCQCKDTNF